MTNQQALDNWLKQVEASLYWQQTIAGWGTVACYIVNGHQILVLRIADEWDIYRPMTTTQTVKRTLITAERFCGLT